MGIKITKEWTELYCKHVRLTQKKILTMGNNKKVNHNQV